MAVLQPHAQKKPDKPESGGVLLGRYILDCQDVVVDAVTLPMDGDRQSRFRFFRDAQRHQEAIHRAWEESSGTCNYLGEWHTHPESYPTPSHIDIAEWKRILLRDRFDSDVLYFVIIGTCSINVWCGYCHGCRIEKLGRVLHE